MNVCSAFCAKIEYCFFVYQEISEFDALHCRKYIELSTVEIDDDVIRDYYLDNIHESKDQY